jgi:pyruvate dehydrogenase E1 component
MGAVGGWGPTPARLKAIVADSPAPKPPEPTGAIAGPRSGRPRGAEQSTQAASAASCSISPNRASRSRPYRHDRARRHPDHQSGAFVNQRGCSAAGTGDVFQQAKIPSAQNGRRTRPASTSSSASPRTTSSCCSPRLGLAAPHFGTRLLPVGTVYDPFIARGLDALNYGCYQDSRFLLVGTPSGLTLAAEGGAHQSINTPLIGMGQPGLTLFRAAFADELALMMRWPSITCSSPMAARSTCASALARSVSRDRVDAAGKPTP